MPNAETLTWKDVVEQALRQLGGEASLAAINAKVEGHPKCATNPTWRDTIRRVVRQYKVFEPVEPKKRTGTYRLVELPKPPATSADKSPDREQGMLLALGGIFNYGTLAPSYDCSKRKFAGKPLSHYASLRSEERVNTSVRQFHLLHIDAAWLAEEGDLFYPRYAFEVENNQNISAAIIRLLEIPASLRTELFVVAPGKSDERRFKKHLEAAGVRSHADRFHYLPYDDVALLYESGTQFDLLRRRYGLEFLS
jgi:hypothetical protein